MAKLGEVCEIVSGSTPKTGNEEYWNGSLCWITPAEISDDDIVITDTSRKISEAGAKSCSLTLMPVGTVLLSSRAPIGKVAITGTEMYCNQGFKNLICSDAIYNKYLFWFLKHNNEFLNSLGRGATFKEISKSIVSDIEIPLPSLEEQHAISATLDTLQSIITHRKQQLAKLDELIKARFVEMFGDPVHNTLQLSTAPMTEVCEIIDGDRGKNYPKQEEFFEEEYCLFLNAKNVTKNGFDFSDCMFITKEKDEVLRKGKLKRGDVVLTTRGTLGNLAFYTDLVPFENVRINSGMVILRMNRDVIDEVFFIEQFRMQIEDIKRTVASGSAQPQLPISTMNKITIVMPDLNAQKSFATFVASINKSKVAVQKALDEAQLLFDSLMQEYFG